MGIASGLGCNAILGIEEPAPERAGSSIGGGPASIECKTESWSDDLDCFEQGAECDACLSAACPQERQDCLENPACMVLVFQYAECIELRDCSDGSTCKEKFALDVLQPLDFCARTSCRSECADRPYLSPCATYAACMRNYCVEVAGFDVSEQACEQLDPVVARCRYGHCWLGESEFPHCNHAVGDECCLEP